MKRTRDRASDLKRQYRGEHELRQGSEGAGAREEDEGGGRSCREISSVSTNMKTRALQMRYLEIVQWKPSQRRLIREGPAGFWDGAGGWAHTDKGACTDDGRH